MAKNVEVIDLSDAPESGIPKSSEAKRQPKRKISAVLRTDISTESIVEGLRIGNFILRNSEKGRASFWQHFALVVDSDDGKELGYIACKKCKVTFKHGSNSGTTHLSDHTETCNKTAAQPKMDAFVTSMVTAATKTEISRALAM
jgi:hypothetical protein